jgi:four helix bundle protein
MQPKLSRASTYRDLVVWKKARALVRLTFEVVNHLPREQRFVLASQMLRCAISIPSNIAEGWGRGSRRELHQFATVARGSLYELETQVDLTEDLEYCTPDSLKAIRGCGSEVGKMLSSLRTSLRAKPNDRRSRS